MKTIQNAIIISLLVTIATGVTYFVANDILEKKAQREYKEQRKIELEENKKAFEKEWEEGREKRESRARRLKEAGENSKYNQMLGN